MGRPYTIKPRESFESGSPDIFDNDIPSRMEAEDVSDSTYASDIHDLDGDDLECMLLSTSQL